MSELVAKWLSTTGIDPARLIDTTDVEFDQLQLSVDPLQLTDSLDEATAIDVPQQEQTKLLSLSVEIGDEAKANATMEACILGKNQKVYYIETWKYMYIYILLSFFLFLCIFYIFRMSFFQIKLICLNAISRIV